MGQKELFAQVTRQIVDMLEAADPANWHAPWHVSGDIAYPVNAVTQRPYRGINTLILQTQANVQGYERGIWATYKQWSSIDAQVRRGEKATVVLLWKRVERTERVDTQSTSDGDAEDSNEEISSSYVFARSFQVFNAAQVDGYDPPPLSTHSTIERIEHADKFFNKLGANIYHGGSRAYYAPAIDRIHIPPANTFNDTEAYYATLGHEYVHWTGHKSRLARDLMNRFGSHAYAAEELIAELGAAYLCAHLHIANHPRADHACYLKSWLAVLREDDRALITAASKAQTAVDWMIAQAHKDDNNVVAHASTFPLSV